jgi:hypoxanthine phosphoribosyltransferase
MTMPDNYQKLHSQPEIDARIQAIASDIIADHGDKDPLFVALLRGAAPFSSKLMFEIAKQAPTLHPEIDYMMVTTYGSGHRAGDPRIVTDLAPSTTIQDRDVIVIDDVLDLGRTANFVQNHLQTLGAKSTQLAVLAEKNVKRDYPVEANYVGFNTGDAWLIGMGMDNSQEVNEAYRWLAEIWEIKPNET